MPPARLLLVPKLFYFCWFGAIGAIVPFVSLYYRGTGLTLGQIGLLVALPGLLQVVASPLWGVLADALRLHRLLLPVAITGTLLPVLLIGHVTSYTALIGLVTVQSLFAAPVSALADSATLALLGTARERYGAQRVWGAVGWGLSTLLFGRLVTQGGLGVIFVGYALLATLAAGAALALPRPALAHVDLRIAARTLLRDRRWFRLLGCVLLVGCCGAAISSFLSLYLQDLGATSQQIGLAYTLAGLSELPVMALSPLLLRRWGARPLLVAAGLLYAVRVAIYIIAPTPGWALAAQLLHGPCFAAFWIAGVVEAQRLAPRGLEATAQSLFGVAAFGVASSLASMVGGSVFQFFGSAALFGLGGMLALCGSIGLLLGPRTTHAKQAESLH